MATSLQEISRKVPSAPQSTSSTSIVNDLEKLNELLERGIITKTEFKKAKDKLLYAGQ